MYIVDIKRTPIGKFLGSLSHIKATELTNPLFSHLIKEYPFLKKDTDEVIIGNVLSAGIGLNPARIASYSNGIGKNVPSYTINHACASGLNAIVQGFRSISIGEADIVIAGGMESMSRAPHLVFGLREGKKIGEYLLVDSINNDGLYCTLSNCSMGLTAENVAKKYSILREDQDKYAYDSHTKALQAQKNKIFDHEIVSMQELSVDETVRQDTSIKKLSSLNPVFKHNGTVTAGNSSSLNDGAALCILMSDKAIKKYNAKPIAKILTSSFVGLSPEYMGMGPKFAVQKLLKKTSLSINDIDIFEINEAFAAQVLAVVKELRIDKKKVNIYGGAIALGHPLGMSGVRLVGSVITALKNTHKRYGIATLCVGGGQGAAILIENI